MKSNRYDADTIINNKCSLLVWGTKTHCFTYYQAGDDLQSLWNAMSVCNKELGSRKRNTFTLYGRFVSSLLSTWLMIQMKWSALEMSKSTRKLFVVFKYFYFHILVEKAAVLFCAIKRDISINRVCIGTVRAKVTKIYCFRRQIHLLQASKFL